MTILEVDDKPVESALQRRLRRIPAGQRQAVTGSFRPVFGRRVFAYDVGPTREATPVRQRHFLVNSLS